MIGKNRGGVGMNRTEQLESVLSSFSDSDIRDRSYYPEFRREWEALLRTALEKDAYFDTDSPACYTVEHSFAGIHTQFHFDQAKIAEWYARELDRKKRIVFTPTRLRRDRQGNLLYHESRCDYDKTAPEPLIDKDNRNIIAAALPGLPPSLSVVYGNKLVETRFNAFLNSRVSLFLIETDYVPAFLASPFEICLYLCMMDICIIKENFKKVKDDQLRQYLHIFRPSPMLKIKGLL